MKNERGISLETLDLMDIELHKPDVSIVVANTTQRGIIVLAINEVDKTANWVEKNNSQIASHGTGKIISSSKKS